ncbi:MAG: hypothetical protein NPIRA02_24940 [Nitrospirales bacterium]|nr:MAG: hypothetical protein NPIRA02_24940 [Nitrospirales bacterium]
MGHVKQGAEFKRAFAAATIHDFFNVISVVIFLPLEIMFGILHKSGAMLSNLMIGGNFMSMKGLNFIKPLVKPPIQAVQLGVFFLFPLSLIGASQAFSW